MSPVLSRPIVDKHRRDTVSRSRPDKFAGENVEAAVAVDVHHFARGMRAPIPFEDMRRELAAGSLGETFYMYCQRLNLGVVRQQENAFWSLAPHDISVILYLFGAEPTGIEARGQDFLQPGVEDVVFANLHFADGRMAHVHVSWLDPHKKRSMVLVGSEKMLVFDDMEPTEKIRVFDKRACPEISTGALAPVHVRHGDILMPHIPMREPLAIETEHFIRAILDDTTPRSDGRDGPWDFLSLRTHDCQVGRARQAHHVGVDMQAMCGPVRWMHRVDRAAEAAFQKIAHHRGGHAPGSPPP